MLFRFLRVICVQGQDSLKGSNLVSEHSWNWALTVGPYGCHGQGPTELSSLLEDSSGMLLFETGQTDPGNPELNNFWTTDVDVLNMNYMLSASFKYCVGDGQFRYIYIYIDSMDYLPVENSDFQ